MIVEFQVILSSFPYLPRLCLPCLPALFRGTFEPPLPNIYALCACRPDHHVYLNTLITECTRMSGVETSETTVLSTSEGPRSRRGRDRSFKCSISGCEKSFTRAEHLHRHALNHTNVDWPCDLCTVNFKRKDLLGKCRMTNRRCFRNVRVKISG